MSALPPTPEDAVPTSARILTTSDGSRYLLYRGPAEIVRYMLRLPEARTYDSGTALVLPLTAANLMVLEVLGRLEEPDAEYAAAARELLWPSDRAVGLYPPSAPEAPAPRWHQTATFGWCLDAFIAGKRGFLMANTLGSGKTRTAIDLMRHFVQTRALVIGQKTTLEQWKEELARAWPEAQPHVLHQAGKGTLPERRNHLRSLQSLLGTGAPEVILVNWEALADLEKDLKQFPKFDMLVADEASRLLGRTTKMARAAKGLAWKHAWYVLALTGTPIRRSVEDLLALFQFVDSSVFGSRIDDFRAEYCEESFAGIGKLTYTPRPEKVPELIRRLYSAGFRVSRAAVDLPEPVRETVVLPASDEQREQLRRIKSEMDADAANVLARMLRQQQITAGFVPMFGDAPEASADGEHQAVLAPRWLDDPKLLWISRYLFDVLPVEETHVIIWTKFIPEIHRLYLTLSNLFDGQVARIDGSVPDRERQTIRRRFNDRGDRLRVLVMNLQTGAMGLDLPAADVSIYHSSTFNYVDREQSEGRGTRLGRLQPCRLIDLCLAGTIDQEIQDNLATKKGIEALLVGQGFVRKPP